MLIRFKYHLDDLDHEDEGEGEREDDEDQGEDGEGHGAHPRALLAPCTRGTATVYWTLLPRLTEGVLAVTIVVVRLQRCRASHLYFSTRAALNR